MSPPPAEAAGAAGAAGAGVGAGAAALAGALSPPPLALAFSSCSSATIAFTSGSLSTSLLFLPSAFSAAFFSRILSPSAWTGSPDPLEVAGAAAAFGAAGAGAAAGFSAFFGSALGSAAFFASAFGAGAFLAAGAAMTAFGFSAWVHSATSPSTALNCGMPQHFSNQAQTFGKPFLKAGSKTRLKPSTRLHTKAMSARLIKLPIKNGDLAS
mmetsp:Transcript_43770/g.79921  ORF Transcript_43770/g.79921 Transcript_43770/m.79921 type:complete len:211 (+) Transcript_43770:261-893(+)